MQVTFRVSNGVSEYNAMSSLVKRLGNIAESLLAGRIPDIESDGLSFILNAFDFKIDSNCG